MRKANQNRKASVYIKTKARAALFLLALAATMCLALSSCVFVPTEPPENPEDTVPDDTKLDIIESAVLVFKQSGSDAIKSIISSYPTMEELVGMLNGEISFDKNSLPSVYFGDGTLILDNHTSEGALDVYSLRGNTLVEISGNSITDEWRLDKNTDLASYIKDTRSVLGLLTDGLSALDFSRIEKSDLTYNDGCFYISESYIKAELTSVFTAILKSDAYSGNVINAPNEEQMEEYINSLNIKLGFIIKSSKLVGVRADVSLADSASLDIKAFRVSLEYIIDTASSLPYMLSLLIDAEDMTGAKISADIKMMTLFNEENNLTGINLKLSADGALPLYTMTLDSGERMTALADTSLTLDMMLDGAKILSTDGEVLKLDAALATSGDVRYLYFDKDLNSVDTSSAFTEADRNKAKDAISNLSFKLNAKAINTDIKQGFVNISLQKNRVLQETVGNIIYFRSEKYPGTEKLTEFINQIKAE